MTELATRIRTIRDERISEHETALEEGDTGRLFTALVVTSATIGNLLDRTHGDGYDIDRTHGYLRVAAREQSLHHAGGVASATTVAAFAVMEFTRQSPRQWQVMWHHGGGLNPRPEHESAAGLVVNAEDGFDVQPGMGAPGCSCYAEPINPR